MGTLREAARRPVSTFLIALGIALGTAPASEAGLLGLWRFDEGSGMTAADSSGNGNTGTLNGASWVLGRFGNALSFDGNDWVDFSTSDAIHALSGPMTVETWVKGSLSDNPGYSLVFDKSHGGPDSTGWVLQFHPSSGPLDFGLGRGGGLGNFGAVQADGPSLLNTNWHHVAGTFDSVGMMRMYVDGVLVDGPDPLAQLTHATNFRKMEMGRLWLGWAPRYFTGAIDETALWDEALSQSTIQSHYQCGIGNPCPVPEPATLLLLGAGIAGLCLWRRKSVVNIKAVLGRSRPFSGAAPSYRARWEGAGASDPGCSSGP